MHIVNTIKTYICEYAFINSFKVSILQYKKKELFKTKWPYFINICRLQIIIGLIQIICNSLLFTNYDKYKSIDVSISFIINIIDRFILNKINNKGKFIIIIFIITCYSLYLTIFHNHQILSLELITNLMWMIILIGTQPLFIFKYIMFLSYYLYLCSYLAFWQQNYYDFIIVILIFILLTISEEEKFRKLIQNQIIPQQIINSLPQPIFLIKLSTLELLICNDQFKQFIQQFNETKQNNISKILTHFESYGNQKILDLEDSDGLNLYETIQIIKLKQSNIKSFSYQFTYNNKVYDARFQTNILYNDYRCVLVSLSDISVVIERAKLTERTILKSKLIKSLSHELRTRKNIIQGLLKLHLDKYKEKKNNELIFQAYNNSKIESNIISSILNYNLCLDNQITVKYQQIKVNEFLDKTLENFKYDLKQKSIQVLCNHYPETDYSLITDPELFEQIITNIISNSIKHCDKGNQSILSISISKETYPITQLEASNRKIAYKSYIKQQNQSSFQSNGIDCSLQVYETTLNIKIIDNGSGITSQKLKLIQEILQNDNYYQFAQSSSDGFYLGLRSCNLLLQKLNKSNRVDILIKSKENEETEVILKFAIHESDQIGIEDNIQKVKTSISKLQYTCNCQQTILIVDDEPFNNLVLEQILQSLGFSVKKALNGLEALQIYRKQHIICKNQSCKLFYAIFMDYQMPVMNGLESAKAIIDECNQFQRKQTDIIGCTAFSATDDINHLLKAGMKTQRFYKININDHMNNQFTNNSTLFSDQSLTPLQIREITTEILQKPSYLRKQKDIQILQLATQNIKFFQEILQDEGIQVLQKCLSKIQLEIYSESTIVFEKGDKGRDFYIILSGQVGIYIFSQNIESNQQIKIPIRQAIKDHVNQLIKQGTKPSSEHSIEIRKILLFEKTKKLLKVNELHEGDSFGERALINEAARLATVVCETECYFGVLNKQDYREILQQAQSEKIQHQITELQSIQGFQGMSRKLLTILLYAFQSQEYKFRDIVYKQGQPSKQEIYLILNGEFMITQDKKIKTFNPYKINYQGVKSIAILQKGSIFGDKESFQQIENRTQTISCNSDYGKVLCIQLNQLQQRLQANNEMHLINELQQQLQIKEVSREIRTNISQIHMKSPKRPKSVLYQNSPNQKIDEIVKQKKKIFEWLNKDVKVKTQFIFDLHPPRSKTPIQQQSTQNQSRQIRRGSAIEKILQNHLDTNSRNMKRKSLDQTTQNCKQEIRRFSFF